MNCIHNPGEKEVSFMRVIKIIELKNPSIVS